MAEINVSRSRAPFLGIGLKVAAALAFTLMGVLIKLVGDQVPTGEIVFFRSAFALLPLGLYLAWRGEQRTATRTNRPGGHVVRGAVGVTAMALNFFGIATLPLADATALFYAAPIFTVVFAALFLGETVRFYRWSAVAVGFAGVLLTLAPHLGEGAAARSTLGAILTLVAAIFAAIAMTQVRRLTATETTGSIVLYFTLTTTLFGLLSLPAGLIVPGLAWVMPASASDLLALVGIGIIGGIAQICLTQAYRYADASLIAPFEYASILFAILIGLAVFGEVPQPVVLVGAAIIVAAGIFVVLRERALGLRRAGSPPAT